jgi:hypothetical protein
MERNMIKFNYFFYILFIASINVNGMHKRWEEFCSQERRATFHTRFSAMGLTISERHTLIKELIESKDPEKLELIEGLICSNRDSGGLYLYDKNSLRNEFAKLFEHGIECNNIQVIAKFIGDQYLDLNGGLYDHYLKMSITSSEEMTKLLLGAVSDSNILQAKGTADHCLPRHHSKTRYGCSVFKKRYDKVWDDEYERRRKLLEQEKKKKENRNERLFQAMKGADAELEIVRIRTKEQEMK